MELEGTSDKQVVTTSTNESNGDATINTTDVTDDRRCWSINCFMVPAKVAYFFNVSRREIDTYFVLFFMSLGFNSAEAGVLSGLQYIGGIVGAAGWSYVADTFRIHKVLVITLGAMAILTTSVQPIFGIPFANKNRFKCPFNRNGTNVDNIEYSTSSNHNILFYSILLISMLGKSFDASVASFVDTGCLYRVKRSPRKADYGGQRFIGSLGVGFGGMAYSISIMVFPPTLMSCESGIFIVYALVVILLNISCYFLFRGIELEAGEIDGKNINNILMSTLKDVDTLFFLLSVLFGGIAQGLFFNFLFVRLRELNAVSLIFGYQTCVVAVSGSVAYYCSERIIKIVGGPLNAMTLSCFAWALRFFCVSLITNPYYIFPIEIFHGVTYSLFLTSAFEHANKISDPVILTTMCGILNGLYIELGSLTSNIAGGKLYHLYGGRNMFIICSLVCLSWGLLMLCYQLFKWIRGRVRVATENDVDNN